MMETKCAPLVGWRVPRLSSLAKVIRSSCILLTSSWRMKRRLTPCVAHDAARACSAAPPLANMAPIWAFQAQISARTSGCCAQPGALPGMATAATRADVASGLRRSREVRALGHHRIALFRLGHEAPAMSRTGRRRRTCRARSRAGSNRTAPATHVRGASVDAPCHDLRMRRPTARGSERRTLVSRQGSVATIGRKGRLGGRSAAAGGDGVAARPRRSATRRRRDAAPRAASSPAASRRRAWSPRPRGAASRSRR